MIKELARKLATRFLKAELLDDVFLDTLENEENFHLLSETNIGLSAKMKLVDLYEGSITNEDKMKGFEAAQAFYKSSLEYVLKKISFNEDFWIHEIWINFFNRKEAKWADVNYFAERYHKLLNMDGKKYDKLFDEFQDFNSIGEEI